MKKLLPLIFMLAATASSAQQQTISVYFDFNKYDLTEQATSQLDSLLRTAGKLISIELSGHCDAIGNHPYNDKLSLLRTAAVKEYLLNKGVLETNFNPELGFGKRKPVNDNSTAGLRSVNRRVDILFSVEQETVQQKTSEIIPPADTATTLETKLKNASVKPGDNIVLKNLNFIGGRHIVLKSSEPVLDELLAVMKNFPSLKIEIQGHICCLYNGTDGLDFDTQTNDLSVNRARAVYDFLVGSGIEASRLSYRGFGSSHPLVFPEKNEEEKTANRRVEIKIIAK